MKKTDKHFICLDCKSELTAHYNRKRCKPCSQTHRSEQGKLRGKKAYYADLEKSRKRGREKYARNVDKYKEYNSSPERKQYCKKWREENKEHDLQRTRDYWRRNTDKRAAISNRYRSLKIDARLPSTDDNKISLIFKACREKTNSTGIPHEVDHIIPLSIGGADHQDNLRIITKEENGFKSDSYVPEFGGIWADNDLSRKWKEEAHG